MPTRLGLVIQFSDDVAVSENYHVELPQGKTLSKPRTLVPVSEPFVVMTAEYWNAFQAMIDELGAREKFQSLHGFVVVVTSKSVVRFPPHSSANDTKETKDETESERDSLSTDP